MKNWLPTKYALSRCTSPALYIDRDTLQRVRLFLKCFIAHLLRLKLNRDIPPTATGLPPWVCPVFYTDQGDTSVCVDLPQQL